MTPTQPTLIERTGDGWHFSFDTAHVPEYMVLTIGGKPTAARTASFMSTLESYDAEFTDASGRYYPTILDLRTLPPPSLDGLKTGRAMVAAITRKQNHLVYLVTPAHRNSALFGVILGVLTRLMPGRFEVTTTLEEAGTAIRAYHNRTR